VHELLHLYGGVHVSDDVPSILNAGGDAMQLDAANARIVSLVRTRRFGPGGLERNVLAVVGPGELADALAGALRLNLHFRRLGLLEAKQELGSSRFVAARRAREAGALDAHLGDVARILSLLREKEGRLSDAVRLLEVAAALYGPRSPAGRAAARRIDAILRAHGIDP
jgi:hypothetical protein